MSSPASAQAEKTVRVLYFDILRVLAIGAVLWVHVSVQNFHSVDIASPEWMIFNIFDAIGRWTVPNLVMISGALFLDPARKLNIPKLFSRSIPRVVTAFLFWSAMYALYQFLHGLSLTEAAQAFLTGHYHMWYLYLMVALYLLAPVLKKVAESDTLSRYLMVTCFAAMFVVPQLFVILSGFDIPFLSGVFYTLQKSYNTLQGYLPTGYIFYYLMGDYLARHEISPRLRKIAYSLGVLGFFATVILSRWYSGVLGYADSSFYMEISMNIAAMSVAMFLFGKYHLSKITFRGAALKVLLHISKCCFGIYLVHDLCIMLIRDYLHLTPLSFHPLLSIPVIFVMVFLGSYLISAIINKFPAISKYIA